MPYGQAPYPNQPGNAYPYQGGQPQNTYNSPYAQPPPGYSSPYGQPKQPYPDPYFQQVAQNVGPTYPQSAYTPYSRQSNLQPGYNGPAPPNWWLDSIRYSFKLYSSIIFSIFWLLYLSYDFISMSEGFFYFNNNLQKNKSAPWPRSYFLSTFLLLVILNTAICTLIGVLSNIVIAIKYYGDFLIPKSTFFLLLSFMRMQTLRIHIRK